ncbi:MAG: DNA-processing protein DprA [Clostridia bacterium]|nr:DNA-processing protein DprA [Clostridia bacterium]
MRTFEDKILLALACVKELCLKKKTSLLECVDDVNELVSAAARETVFKLLGDEAATEFFENLAKIDDIQKELDAHEIEYVTYLDDDYPEKLFEIYDRPQVLFLKGNKRALKEDAIAVVGTRKPTRYGVKIADAFAREFAQAGLVVVSGFARGIDATAHKACVSNGLKTIAVFACGLDVCYPAEHRGLLDGILQNDGLLVSEYPLGSKPLQYHFPERNRIISGLARAVFLPEAAKNSGSLITMRLAIEQGREIFVTPGNIFEDEAAGSNELLKEMPHALTFSPDDVLDALRVNREVREKEAVELSIAETQIVDALHDNELHFEELLEITGLTVAELTNTLINLELNGIVEQTSGNYYILA